MAGNNNGTDLTGFPIGEAVRLEEERLSRIHDPNFNPGPDWVELKANAEMFKAELASRQIPNRIPESIFVRNFLKMFAVLYTRDPNQIDAVSDSGNIYRWIQIAGMPYRPVDVTSDKDGSKIVFTVPPIFRRTRSILNRDPGISFLSMIHQAQQIHAKSPQSGTRFYNEALLQFSPRDSREHFLADQVQWLVIFDHYQVPLWDERTRSYKTVKELKALDNITVFKGTLDSPSVAPTEKIKSRPSRVEDIEEF